MLLEPLVHKPDMNSLASTISVVTATALIRSRESDAFRIVQKGSPSVPRPSSALDRVLVLRTASLTRQESGEMMQAAQARPRS